MNKWKTLQTCLSIVIVLAIVLLVYFSPSGIEKEITSIENHFYDLRLRFMYKPLNKNVPITIVDINDDSLKAEGRWPWPRDKLATLVKNLLSLGANTIAFDLTFPEPEKNAVVEVINKLEEQSTETNAPMIRELQKIEPDFAYDKQFAQSLSSGNCVLGYIFTNKNIIENMLPPPLLEISKNLSNEIGIPNMNGYLSNIPLLQDAAKNGGFLNASPDPDGICRYVPLFLRRGQNIYPSLALEAARVYLLTEPPSLITAKYGNTSVLEGINFDQTTIPTNPWGQVLIPFRGPPFSFPHISAKDVLNGNVDSSVIANKLIFIGSTASAMGDLFATSISPVFSGVEIHSTIASGIIDRYFPYIPNWEKGSTIVSILFIGFLSAFVFPRLSALKVSFVYLLLFLAVIIGNTTLWMQKGIVLPIVLPIFTLSFLFILDVVMGYFFETRQKKKMRSVFNQYLPSQRIEQILTSGNKLSMDGENKEMSVLFADIRNFTNLCEKMPAKEIKKFLSVIFTPLTAVIFQNKGTIDKYVGDMIMAFWGAPIEDPEHSKNAARTAYEIQISIENVNKKLTSLNLPSIRIGVGVVTGFMNVGDMGSQYRLSYTVIGDNVNLASRLESLTKFYGVNIIVGEKTWKDNKNDFLFRKLDFVRVKGKVSLQHIYELICPNDKVTMDLITYVQKHEKALEAYWHRDFLEAKTAFLELQTIDQSHAHLYQIYLDRIAKFLILPPEKDWDGAYNFETK